VLVQAVIEQIRRYGAQSVAELSGVEESTVFALPLGLRDK
jgi:4-hydroxy-3-methylbut-2-enyl diphosphate reductase